MALNLIRNSKLLFTSNVNATTGVLNDTQLTTVSSIKASGVVAVASVNFPASSSNTFLSVGKMVTVTGTAGTADTGSITGYASGNTYFVTDVTGTDITLSATYAGTTAITTTAGTSTGLIVNVAANRTLTTKTLTVDTATGNFSALVSDIGLLQTGDVIILVGAASGAGAITGYSATGTVYYVKDSHVGVNPSSSVTTKELTNYFTLATGSPTGTTVTTTVGSLTVATSITIYNRFSSTNTQEIQVLDGFSFSQNTNNEQVTISEAGNIPKRGQRSFNTSLAPVDFSFSTYIRPTKSTNVTCEESVLWNALMGVERANTKATTAGADLPYASAGTISYSYNASAGTITVSTSDNIFTRFPTVGLKFLINGITSTEVNDIDLVNGPATVTTSTSSSIVFTMDNQTNTIGTTTPAGTAGTLTWTGITFYRSAWGESTTSSILAGHASNANQLQKFSLLVIVDNVTYAIDNCALNEATIDFGLDGIATVQWTGQATTLRQLTTSITLNASNTTISGSISGSYNAKYTTAKYITNKLSTCRLKVAKKLLNAAGTTIADIGNAYFLPITGGSITISNNISYITPAILGVVNSPVTYYTATRSVTGTLNAYLNTGTLVGATVGGVTVADGTGELLADLVAVADVETEPLFYIELALGGPTATTRVELQMPSVSIGIPTINVEQVISTAINFTGAASTGSYSSRKYDLDKTNELTIRYFTP